MTPPASWMSDPFESPEVKLVRGSWQKLCPVGEVEPGHMREVFVTGLRVLVIQPEDGPYAVTGALCPHEEVALVQGAAKDGVLRCFEHGYGFDLKTGVCDMDEDLCLPVYPARESDGWVEAILLS